MPMPSLPRLSLWWILTRLVVLVLLFGPESKSVGDVGYFAKSLAHIERFGLGSTMPEYPLPALLMVAVPWTLALALSASWLYGFFFVAATLAVDAVFTVALSRSARSSGRVAAVVAWLVAVPVMGGLTFVRFDVVPGVLVGLVVLASVTHPRWAAFLVSLATSIKLWPVLMIPFLASAVRNRWSVLVPVAVVGAASVLVTVAVGGWGRLVSPLVYQADRGLQIESVAATPVMVRFAVIPASSTISYSPFKAYEITGPGVSAMLTVSTVLTVAFVALVLTLWLRTLRTGSSLTPDAFVWSTLCVTLAFMCSSKVLSPQYLLWLLPAACAGLAVVWHSYRQLMVWTCVLGVAAGLSHLLFPSLYTSLAVHGAHTPLAVCVLTLRNGLMIGLLAFSTRMAFVATGSRGLAAPRSGRPRVGTTAPASR